MAIQTVGIVGAGQMGNGIAHVFALAGYDVLMNDVSEDSLSKALATIDRNIERQVTRAKVTAAAKADAMARIKTSLSIADLGPCDLIIEAATEKESVKDAIFKALGPHLAAGTILTSNTSSISITRLASRTDRPEKFMGFHFMNPVPVMQLVELIRGIATDQDTWDTMHEVVRKLGKTAASAEDFPAFTKDIPGLFYFLGVAPKGMDQKSQPANHSPLFFADEAALPTGVRAMTNLAVDYLKSGGIATAKPAMKQ